jgi:hypothetical protein
MIQLQRISEISGDDGASGVFHGIDHDVAQDSEGDGAPRRCVISPRTIRVNGFDDDIKIVGTQLSGWYTNGPGELRDVTTMPAIALFGEIENVLVHDDIL